MKKFATLLVLLATSVTSSAQEAKPNTLTPKEIANGWILLFDGDTTFGWKAGSSEPDVKPSLTVKDGQLVLSGFNTYADLTTRFHYFDLGFDYRTEGSDDAHFRITTPGEGVKPGLVMGYGIQDAQGAQWAHASFRVEPGVLGHRLERPKMKPIDFKEPLPKSYGVSELQFSTDSKKAKNSLFLRNIKLRPIPHTPIFNGKDLNGWKEIEGKKSKFTVNDKGELNIKDGPGDIQTFEEWDDFVLQLDVFSNGKHLNSGVFFRCQRGQFWSGYEAQIRNQWVGDDRTKPVDYGTGGIYNRQPARKVVSSDKEWFTMTVVAHGSHMATWVNGYQVTDFTDTRKPNASARNGLKVDRGPISLQGHDPATDLSFRNIRVEALPRTAEPKK